MTDDQIYSRLGLSGNQPPFYSLENTNTHTYTHTNTHIYTPRENKIIGQETYGWSVRFLYWKHFLLAQSFVSSKLGKNIFSREMSMTFRWPFKISCFLKFFVISRFSRTEGALKRVLGYGRYDQNLITQNFQYISWLLYIYYLIFVIKKWEQRCKK